MIGILLINLGTPEAPTEAAVRKYLDVFLSDPYVITLPKLLRDFLVKKIILPKRPKIAAQAYQQIWTDAGSPLLVNSVLLQNALQNKLGKSYCVALGMRYSHPSIESAIDTLHKNQCEKIIVLPLYPQFANATTQSSLDIVQSVIKNKKLNCEIKIIRDFYHYEAYINSFSKMIRSSLDKTNPDFILLSYHGLPKRQRGASQYRADCFSTSQLIADKLSLPSEKYQTTFQSRLGFAKWLEPYTDRSLIHLRKKGIKKLAVVSPSFVVDCIETLEEINIRLRAQWMQLGGESFEFISCLNADGDWAWQLITHADN